MLTFLRVQNAIKNAMKENKEHLHFVKVDAYERNAGFSVYMVYGMYVVRTVKLSIGFDNRVHGVNGEIFLYLIDDINKAIEEEAGKV